MPVDRDPLWMLQQQEAWALVTSIFREDPVRIGKGWQVFPTWQDALEAWGALGGVRVDPRAYYQFHNVRQPFMAEKQLFIAEFTLPHSWIYDTEPTGPSTYACKFSLDDGVRCGRPSDEDFELLRDQIRERTTT